MDEPVHVVAIEVTGTALVQVVHADPGEAARIAVEQVRAWITPHPLPAPEVKVSEVYVQGGGIVDPSEWEHWSA